MTSPSDAPPDAAARSRWRSARTWCSWAVLSFWMGAEVAVTLLAEVVLAGRPIPWRIGSVRTTKQ